MTDKSLTLTSLEDEKYNRKYAVEALALYEQRNSEGYVSRTIALKRAERFYDLGYRVNPLGYLVEPK